MSRNVYFIRLKDSIFKIGCGNPEDRLRNFKTLYPDAVIEGIIECPNNRAEDIESQLHREFRPYHTERELFDIRDIKIINRSLDFHKGYPMQEYVFNNKVRRTVQTLFDVQNVSVFRPSCAKYPDQTAMPMGKTQGSKSETYRSVYADEYGLPELRPGHPAYKSRKNGRTRVYVSFKFWNERDKHRVKGGKLN